MIQNSDSIQLTRDCDAELIPSGDKIKLIKGEVVKVVDEKDMVSALVQEGKLLAKEGIEARLAAADKDAARIAQQDAEELMGLQGDINNFEERTKSVVEITSKQDND